MCVRKPLESLGGMSWQRYSALQAPLMGTAAGEPLVEELFRRAAIWHGEEDVKLLIHHLHASNCIVYINDDVYIPII